jgi:hypothetical protein
MDTSHREQARRRLAPGEFNSTPFSLHLPGGEHPAGFRGRLWKGRGHTALGKVFDVTEGAYLLAPPIYWAEDLD